MTVHADRKATARSIQRLLGTNYTTALRLTDAPAEAVDAALNTHWETRWVGTGLATPRFVKREMHGNVIVEEFVAAPGVRADAYLNLALKASASRTYPDIERGHELTVRGHSTFINPVREHLGDIVTLGDLGRRFRLILWPNAQAPDLTDPDLPLETVTLWAECQLPIAARAGGLHPPYQLDALEQVVPGVWQMTWWKLNGAADTRLFRERCVRTLSDALGAEVAIDHRADGGLGFAYFGNLTMLAGLPDHDSRHPSAVRDITAEDEWARVWEAADRGIGTNYPIPQLTTRNSTVQPDGTIVDSLVFMCRQGVPPARYFGLEQQLAAAMGGGVTDVSISHHPDVDGLPDTHHPLAFVVSWSTARPETGQARDT